MAPEFRGRLELGEGRCAWKARSQWSSVPGRARARASATAAPRCCASRARARRCWPWIAISPRPRRPRQWSRQKAACVSPSLPTSRTRAPSRPPSHAAHRRWGRVDILHNNVGVSLAGGDTPLAELTEDGLRPHLRDQPARHGDGMQARAARSCAASARARSSTSPRSPRGRSIRWSPTRRPRRR